MIYKYPTIWMYKFNSRKWNENKFEHFMSALDMSWRQQAA